MSNEYERDFETEVYINSLENHEIYNFMRSEYDRITNDGDSYDVEEHDTIVAKAASDKYEINEERAGNVYKDTEVVIADFWNERKNG